MTLASGRVLDRLVAEAPCLGAVFTAYGFDPAFFEDHVLRAVLRLTSDPVEQAARYHGEARRALQETPVVAIVDAGERRPGRRLPFDLLEVSEVVFHPKSGLLLYPERARLLVGSGNLTFAGYGGNTELFVCLDLAYDDARDASLLRSFGAHLDRIAPLARQRGTQLKLFREELARRLGSETETDVAPNYALLDSTTGPILEQLAGMLPENAVVDTIGMLAPSYERDDGGELDVTSVRELHLGGRGSTATGVRCRCGDWSWKLGAEALQSSSGDLLAVGGSPESRRISRCRLGPRIRPGSVHRRRLAEVE